MQYTERLITKSVHKRGMEFNKIYTHLLKSKFENLLINVYSHLTKFAQNRSKKAINGNIRPTDPPNAEVYK